MERVFFRSATVGLGPMVEGKITGRVKEVCQKFMGEIELQ